MSILRACSRPALAARWGRIGVATLFTATTALCVTAAAPNALFARPKDAAPSWVLAKPPTDTQFQKSAEERGINPCNTPEPGFGIYAAWNREPLLGQMIVPERGGVNARGEFDVMLHFHGHEAARKEWVRVMDGAVLVGIDLGIGSGAYDAAFRDPATFPLLVKSVEAAVEKWTRSKRARARHIGLSAWSAGYGAVLRILDQSYGRRHVDAVILLDGLHSGYDSKGLNSLQLAPIVEFSQAAALGDRFLFVSHSSIIPPGYASTTETARFLVWKTGGRPLRARARSGDPMGLDLIERYSKGNFHVRGFAGNDRLDHCAHLGLYRDVLKLHIRPRWSSPQGRKATRTKKAAL